MGILAEEEPTEFGVKEEGEALLLFVSSAVVTTVFVGVSKGPEIPLGDGETQDDDDALSKAV